MSEHLDFYYDKLVRRHEQDTMVCSVWNHAKKCSSVYDELREAGVKAVPALLRACEDEGELRGGMHVMMLLAEIVGDWPKIEEVSDEVEGTGFRGFRVNDAREAWVAWGYEHGFLSR